MRSEQVELPVAVRSEVGKSASRRLRAAGKIPGVVYGRKEATLSIAVDETAFSRSLTGSGWFSTLIKLRIEGAEGQDPEPSVMIKEVQRDFVRQRILSVDFYRVSLEEAVHTQVPVVAVGQSPGVKQGGILEHLAHEVTAECLPTEMPDHLEVDISEIEIGESVRARDIMLPPGVKMLTPEEDVILVVSPPARIEEVAPAAVEEEGALVEESMEPEVIGEQETEEESG